jgi:hypothetical protein
MAAEADGALAAVSTTVNTMAIACKFFFINNLSFH